MKLTDILPLEKWAELEEEINKRSGLNAAVSDVDGVRITELKKWPNRLCPVIKANEKGQTFICSAAHQNIAAQAMQTKKPVIEECDAGLVKLVVPIFVGDEYVGVAGGCGLILDDGEVESFLISKTTGIDEDEIESLSDDISKITTEKAESLVAYIQEEIDRIVSDFENK